MKINLKRPFCYYLLPVTFILLSLFSYGQKEKEITAEMVKDLYNSIPKVNGEYEYTEVVQLDSTFKKDMLYKNSKLFFTNEFKSAKDVIQYDEREEGKVIGKGNFIIEAGQSMMLNYTSSKWRVNFTLEIFSKDGKYKYRIYDFIIAASQRISDNEYHADLNIDEAYKTTERNLVKKMNRKLFVDLVENINGLVSDIKTNMAKNESSSSSDF